MEFFLLLLLLLLLSFLSFLLPAVPMPDHKAICEIQPSLFLTLHTKLFILEKEVNDSLLN